MNLPKQLSNKLINRSDLASKVKELKSEGKSIAFTNGCFDILHKGHVVYLTQASEQADILVLGLNSDDSVRRQGKGENRPINAFSDRAAVLAGLFAIDLVVEFDEDTPINLIEEIVPDVLLKGGDYDPAEKEPNSKTYIVGREVVLENGGTVAVIPFVDGYSTTATIKKLSQ